ncbi:MAG: M66 family metalloprotease [Polyangiaceae bacterium]
MTRLLSLSLSAILVAACTTVVADGSSGGGSGTSGGTSAAPVDPVSTAKLAEGLTLTDVAIFQAVKVPVVTAGERVADSSSPIVAGRPGVLRAYVTPSEGWEAKSVVAYLTLVNAAGKVSKEVKKTVSVASSDDKSGTAFDFVLKGEEVTADLKYSITLAVDGEITTDAAPAESESRYPRNGSQEDLGAAKLADELKIVLVPVQYGADGSGRLPDTSEEQIETYRQTLLSLYPVAKVDIQVRAPYKWNSTIAGNGQGWDDVLNALVRLRAADKVADDVYYYGAFAPKSSFESFCSRGCVTGLSGLADDASDARIRASVGVGFPGVSTANTAAHEIGHAHGRDHAPCGGAQGTDPKYPYPQAKIGVWGYNIITNSFVNPAGAQTPHDMMSYCDPAWISDYQYGKLFDRVIAVNSLRGTQSMNASARLGFRLASIDGEGNIKMGEHIDLPAGTQGAQRKVTYRQANGTLVSDSARFFRYDHLPGGMLFIPEHEGASVVSVEGTRL